MFGLFAEAVEDLYTGIVERYVRKTPALWEEFVMRLENGEMYIWLTLILLQVLQQYQILKSLS